MYRFFFYTTWGSSVSLVTDGEALQRTTTQRRVIGACFCLDCSYWLDPPILASFQSSSPTPPPSFAVPTINPECGLAGYMSTLYNRLMKPRPTPYLCCLLTFSVASPPEQWCNFTDDFAGYWWATHFRGLITRKSRNAFQRISKYIELNWTILE